MSYNGSGTFVINSTGNPVVTGTTISSTWANALTADLATGLSTCVTKDGQTTTTAIVPFAGGINVTSTASSFYIVDTFTATLTGCTTAPTYSIKYTKIGNSVILTFPTGLITATSNATTKTLTGMPSAIRPSGEIYIPVTAGQDAGVSTTVFWNISSAGVITMNNGLVAGPWTGSGTFQAYFPACSYSTA